MEKMAGRTGKKKYGKLMCAFVAAGVVAIMSMGCGETFDFSGQMTSPESRPNSSDSMASSGNGNGGGAGAGNLYGSEGAQVTEDGMGDNNISDARKLVTTVNLELETKEFEQTMSGIEAKIQELGGYIESMDVYNGSSYAGSRSNRYADMKIRIPAPKLNSFMNTVSDIGNIIRRNDNVEDVTLSYVDMESRRDTLRTEQSRLLEFLDRADSVETVIALEERLSEVRYQLESMESRLRTLDNLVEYSTVSLNVTEVRELTPVVKQTVWERIGTGISENVSDILNGIVEAFVWFVIQIPYLVIWAAVLGIVIWRLRKSWQKRHNKAKDNQKPSD